MALVYSSWSRTEYVQRHIPQEFKEITSKLTARDLEKFTEAIDAYYQRIRVQIERSIKP